MDKILTAIQALINSPLLFGTVLVSSSVFLLCLRSPVSVDYLGLQPFVQYRGFASLAVIVSGAWFLFRTVLYWICAFQRWQAEEVRKKKPRTL